MPSAPTRPSAPLEVRLADDAPAVLAVEEPDDPADWAFTHREALRATVTEHGAVVVRGLGIADAAGFAPVARALAGGELMTEVEAFAPRSAVDGVYTATPWPAHEQMCQHHELSYLRTPPGLMMFACTVAPADGGATPVASAADVLADLPAALVDRFEREGWRLERSYTDEVGASWADAFGTADRAAVEAYCTAQGIEFAWQSGGGLTTSQLRPAVVTHPVTGRRGWVNQIAFLSEWILDEDVREFFLDEYDARPFTTRHADGTPVAEEDVATINEVYARHTRRLPWEGGDLLLVDNLSTSHGREPFSGPREVLAALAEPVVVDDSHELRRHS
ncbi:TauD/TfdA family dioxygenase [Actinomycetospora termitidis]|uniref:TauD/TfdA family dioxygenase n=1 Tax=Actinomycetospora termitidis TaxID=3053470 RepID=A0ABT7MJN3_9PSEU|nr:TauD/TfdA family dioxygenase [Actinomycetospora sp. Odt1-22]MDL5159568.1 TauD/TfdA family dioxygenase [Actinomycetospora sp. Odt1-22]